MSKRKGANHHYYRQNERKRRKQVLEVGMRGFLFTCNSKFKYSIREAYNILDDYGNKLFGLEEESEICDKNEEEEDGKKEIEDELQKEVESLKKVKSSSNAKRFQVVESGANSCLFIKTTVPDPVELVKRVMGDVCSSQQQISRYLMRFLPVEVTCKAYVADIKKTCEKLFEKHFTCEPTTYCIVYSKRFNDNLLRDEVIESVARLVQDRNILHKVDLKNGEKAITISVIKSICCISVITDYFKFKKYNLAELVKKCDDITSGTSAKLETVTDDKINDEINVEPPSNDNLCKE